VSDFAATLAAHGRAPLRARLPRVVQLNIGRLCNLRCRHCHVDAGPHRTTEQAPREVLDAALGLIDALVARGAPPVVDLTGGAPELHADFRWLVTELARRGLHVMDRCNLTVLLLPQHAELPAFLAEHRVEVVASLPHWRAPNTDGQRGEGVHARSIEALRRLNAVGYGQRDPARTLTLVHNPAGAFLPAGQASMEREWREGLARVHGVNFDRLIALNNMPIARFAEWLRERGQWEAYNDTLVRAFNPAAVAGLMCHDTLSVAPDGTLHDCDFNQVLGLPADTPAPNLRSLAPGALLDALTGRAVVTGPHCFGCTAGAGSSCGGATA
jgi:radical SAM/Cys-rich protein